MSTIPGQSNRTWLAPCIGAPPFRGAPSVWNEPSEADLRRLPGLYTTEHVPLAEKLIHDPPPRSTGRTKHQHRRLGCLCLPGPGIDGIRLILPRATGHQCQRAKQASQTTQ